MIEKAIQQQKELCAKQWFLTKELKEIIKVNYRNKNNIEARQI